jgi:capping protein beta
MDIVSSMLDLMRRLPPTKIEENVDALVQISPDYADDLSGNVDQPLKLRVDKATGKEYLACVYNQDGESYRCAAAPFLSWDVCLSWLAVCGQIALVERV